MAEPRRVSTRRAVLSFSQLKQMNPNWADLMIKDYQGIIEDFAFTADEIDTLELRVIENEEDIIALDLRVTENEEDIVDLQLRVAALEYRVYEIVPTTISLTAEEFQTIICSNTTPINITLKIDPVTGDEVNIKRRGGSVVVIGTIDGFTNKTLNVLNYSIKLVFNGTDWSEI